MSTDRSVRSSDRAGTAGRSQPTMRDIALHAGVSPMSVSRALRGGSGVSEETRARVLAAVEKFGYQRNEFARQLRSGGPTNVIALVVTHLANPFYAEFALGVERAATRRGSRVMILSTMGELATEREVVRDLSRRQVDGVVIVPAGPDHRHLVALARPDRPLVFAATPPNGIAADCVTVDDFGGMYALCAHLLSAGHRRIGLLGLDRAMWTGSERFRGYAAAHAEASILVDHRLIAEHDGDIRWSMAATRKLLKLSDPPSAIIAANNRMTVGALRAVRDAGSGVTIAGFDDIEVADLFEHPLTVVRYDPAELGRRTAELLFARRAQTGDVNSDAAAAPAPVREVLPTELIQYGHEAQAHQDTSR